MFNNLIAKLNLSNIIRETSWVMAGNFVTIICSSIFTFYSAKVLGVEAYGLAALIIAGVALIQELFSFRTWEAVLSFGFKKIAESKDSFMRVFLSLVIFDFLIYLIVFILILLGNRIIERYLLDGLGHNFDLIIYALVTLFTFNKGTFSAYIRIFKRYDINSLINASISFSKLLFGVIFLTISPSLLSYFLANLITSLVSFLLYFIFFIKLSKKNGISIWGNFPNLKEFLEVMKEVKSFITTTYWVSTLKSITTRVTPIIIGRFLSLELVGMYKLARDITTLFTLAITDTIYNIAYPKISNLLVKKPNGLIKHIAFFILFGVFGVALYGIGIFIFGETILNLLFQEYSSVINVLKLVTIELFVLVHPSWMIPLIMCSGLEKHNLISRIINSFILVVFLLLLTPNYGLIGVQFAVIISSVVYVLYLGVISLMILKNVKAREFVTQGDGSFV